MKTICPLRYHHNGFAATHTLGHITVHHVAKCMSCHKAIVVITGRINYDHLYIYIYIYIYIFEKYTLHKLILRLRNKNKLKRYKIKLLPDISKVSE